MSRRKNFVPGPLPCAPVDIPHVQAPAPLTERERLARALAAVDAHLEKITAPGVAHNSADVARTLANREKVKSEIAALDKAARWASLR
jgi:hypothetical protein